MKLLTHSLQAVFLCWYWCRWCWVDWKGYYYTTF